MTSSQAQGKGVNIFKRRWRKAAQKVKTILRIALKTPDENVTAAESPSGPIQISTSATNPILTTDDAKPEEVPKEPEPRPLDTLDTKSKGASKTEKASKKLIVTVVSRKEIEEERKRRLAERYGLVFEPFEWAASQQTVERIHKPIRMRFHRICHNCETTFGNTKVCVRCEHVRCTRCPRDPVKKDKISKDIGKGMAQATVCAVGTEGLPEGHKRKYPLTKPSRTGGQDLVRKKPMQRVRRNCHECGARFHSGNKICPNTECKHIRCVECPRDPSKRHLYPDGYPGDAPAPADMPADQIKHPTRFKCHSCNAVIPRGTMTCTCGHEKCEQCTRVPPKKLKYREYDPETGRQLSERLAALRVSRVGSQPVAG